MSRQLWYGRVHRSKAEQGYRHLREIYDGRNQKVEADQSKKKILTNEDSQLEAATHLLETASRMQNAVSVLEDYCKFFSDPSSSKTKIRLKTQHLKRYITPLLAFAAVSIEKTARTLAPIASLQYVHSRNECVKVKEVVDPTNSRMSSDLQLIHDFVTSAKKKRKADDKIDITPVRKKSHRVVSPTDERMILPVPKKGSYYRKPEVVEILSQYPAGKKERGLAIRKMIELKYVPSSGQFSKDESLQRAIRRLMAKAEKGEPIMDTDWRMGRPAICNMEEMTQMANSMEEHSGLSWEDVDVHKLLVDSHLKKIEDAGFKALDRDLRFDVKTQRNYAALLANQPNISIARSTVPKTNTRIAAENSIRGSIALAALVGATHFIPVEDLDPDMRAEIKGLPYETRMMTDMVSAAMGTDVFPADPAYIYSTDDTTEYIFEGTRRKDAKFVFTFSAKGNCFPLCVTASGLTEKEMPDKDFVVVKIPGLCLGGGMINPSNKQLGYLMLMRNTEGAEKARFAWYQKNILLPGIELQREVYGKWSAKSGIPLPDKLTAISACDGDLSQIHAIKKCVEEFVENKVVGLKQNAARSAVEQGADLANVFNVIKKELPEHTVSDESHPFKDTILEAFAHDDLKTMSWKSTKKKMDLSCLDESACLLAVDSNSFLPCIAFKHREGCYLYYDRNLGAFVRSGKVTRRGFVVRDDEHVKGAMASSANSHFYFVYPSKHSSRADKRDKQGLFENLIQLIGAGFDPTADSAKVLEKGHDEGGLLILNAI